MKHLARKALEASENSRIAAILAEFKKALSALRTAFRNDVAARKQRKEQDDIRAILRSLGE